MDIDYYHTQLGVWGTVRPLVQSFGLGQGTKPLENIEMLHVIVPNWGKKTTLALYVAYDFSSYIRWLSLVFMVKLENGKTSFSKRLFLSLDLFRTGHQSTNILKNRGSRLPLSYCWNSRSQQKCVNSAKVSKFTIHGVINKQITVHRKGDDHNSFK